MNLDREKLRITDNVIRQIEQTIGSYPPECGGILGAQEDGTVSEFYFDYLGKGTSNCYSPDVESINKVLAEDWMPRGIYMVGRKKAEYEKYRAKYKEYRGVIVCYMTQFYTRMMEVKKWLLKL